MEEKVYFKIMNDLKKHDYQGRISPYDMNEPTLDKRLPMFIEETRKMFLKNNIYIGSNGVDITPEYVEMLFTKGLSSILITCYDEFVYEKFKKMASQDKRVRLLTIFDKDVDKVFMNRGGNVKVGPDIKVKKPCKKGLVQVMVNYKGDIVQCCSDYFYTNVAGNVMDADVYRLWNCKNYKIMREYLSQGIREKIPLCKNCNYQKW
jgi:radical SAM protein with 4Fe4S-binding SPASM domain